MTPRRRMQSGCVFNFQERKDSINQTSADFYAYSSSFSYKKEKSERISHWEDTVRIILIFGRSVVKGSELSGHHLPNRSPAKRVRWGKEEQGSERNFRRQAEMEWSGLCEDEVAVVRRGRPPAHFWFLFVRTKRNSPSGET